MVRYFASKGENGSTYSLGGVSGSNWEAVRFCLSSNHALGNIFFKLMNKVVEQF